MKVHTNGKPIFSVIKRGIHLVTEPCPFCKPKDRRRKPVRHYHGAQGETPGRLSHRVEHCAIKGTVEIDGQMVSNEGGYYLDWDGSEERTAKPRQSK